jgi:hypothetical protein
MKFNDMLIILWSIVALLIVTKILLGKGEF